MRRDWNEDVSVVDTVPGPTGDLTGLPPSPRGTQPRRVSGPGVMRLYLLAYNAGTLGIEIDEVGGGTKLDAYSAVVKTFRFAR